MPVLKIRNEIVDLRNLVKDWPHLAGLKVPPQRPVDVNVLIGWCDMAPQEILEIKKDPLNERAPRGLHTAFGWCIAGPISSVANAQLKCNSLSLTPPADEDLANAINRFLFLETYEEKADAKAPVGTEELRAVNILNETTRFLGDRYEAGLLWKKEDPNLPDNSESVLAHFFQAGAATYRRQEFGHAKFRRNQRIHQSWPRKKAFSRRGKDTTSWSYLVYSSPPGDK